MRTEIRELVEDPHEIALAGRVVMGPRDALRGVIRRRAITYPYERELTVVGSVRQDRIDTESAAAWELTQLRRRCDDATKDDRAKDRSDSPSSRHGFFPSSCWMVRVF